MDRPFSAYRKELQSKLATGVAREHTYRPTLQQLLQQLGGKDITVLNEAQQVQHNAPDFTIHRKGIPIGYVECKDIGTDLDAAERSRQLQRYRKAFNNLLLTDYLSFRWYVGGEHKTTVRLGAVTPAGSVQTAPSELHPETLFLNFFQPATLEIRTSRQLARHMASRAQLFKETMASILREERDRGTFRALCEKLKKEMIVDLTDEAFADIYAQTAAYALFAARCLTYNNGQRGFSKGDAVLGSTTDLLSHFFAKIAGKKTDKRLTWIVDELFQLLAGDWFGEILQDLRGGGETEDPVVYFYEYFLREYDPTLKVEKGVFYTPKPVVQYIVRSVDALLDSHFGLSDGLADQQRVTYSAVINGKPEERSTGRVLVLDPATGTGTFLREVIALIRERVLAQGMAGAWPEFARTHLLERLYGFELLVAPYTMCHLKLKMELAIGDHGVTLKDWQRFNVYLTNTLAEPAKKPSALWQADPITAEAKLADDVKRDVPVMVVLGNPPYSRNSSNTGDWIKELLRPKSGADPKMDYYSVDGAPLGERQPGSLQDDYVKFIRFAQHRIDQTGEGVLAFVTNRAYLNNITFRGMRESLMQSFSEIYVLDLHGDAYLSSSAPDDVKDQNVFDIQQGVAIGLFVKRKGTGGKPAKVFHAELWGPRAVKYDWLSRHASDVTEWTEVHPASPWYMFVPGADDHAGEFTAWHSLKQDIFLEQTAAMQTCRDRITIHRSKQAVMDFVQAFVQMSPEDARNHYKAGKDSRGWKVHLAQQSIRETGISPEFVQPVAFRPYDVRFTYYNHRSRGFVCRPVFKVMQHMIHGPNLGLVTARQVAGDEFNHVLITSHVCTHRLLFDRIGSAYMFPLYIYNGGMGRQPNLCQRFVRFVAKRLNLVWTADGRGDGSTAFGPEDLLYYMYAFLHSPNYRTRYLSALKVDFPRIPVTSRPALFWRLVALGDRLAQLHLMRQHGRDLPGFPVLGMNRVDTIRSRLRGGKLWINKRQYFSDFKEEVWRFMQCGYRPLDKWLKERKNKVLSVRDIYHFRRMHGAIAATMQLMQQIDEVFSEHGGWPLADDTDTQGDG